MIGGIVPIGGATVRGAPFESEPLPPQAMTKPPHATVNASFNKLPYFLWGNFFIKFFIV